MPRILGRVGYVARLAVSLQEFLRLNEKTILSDAEAKALQLAGARPASEQMKRGLPIFFKQLQDVLEYAPGDPPPGIRHR